MGRSLSKYPAQVSPKSPRTVEDIKQTGNRMLEHGRRLQREEQARHSRGEEPEWQLKAVSSAEKLQRKEERERAEAARAAKVQELLGQMRDLGHALEEGANKSGHGKGARAGMRREGEGTGTSSASAQRKESSPSSDDFHEVKRNEGQHSSPGEERKLHRRAAQPVFEKGFLDRAKKPTSNGEDQGREGEHPRADSPERQQAPVSESPSTSRSHEPAPPHGGHRSDHPAPAPRQPTHPARGSPRPHPSAARAEAARRRAAVALARALHGLTEAAFQRQMRDPRVRAALRREMDQWYGEALRRPGLDPRLVAHLHTLGLRDLALGTLDERLGPGVVSPRDAAEVARRDRAAGRSAARDRRLVAEVRRLLPHAQPPAESGERAGEGGAGEGVRGGSDSSSGSSSPRIGTTVHRDPSA